MLLTSCGQEKSKQKILPVSDTIAAKNNSIEYNNLIVETKKVLKEIKASKKPQLLKANGEPYTEADLEFIWKHGYQSALEMVQQTKQ